MLYSILDTDLYKFSTSYAYFKLYPNADGMFAFTDRTNTVMTTEQFDLLNHQIAKMSSMALTDDELEWCVKHIPYIPRCYWEWLRGFRLDGNRIERWLDGDGRLHMQVCDKLYKATLYEVPLLAIVSCIMTGCVDCGTCGYAGLIESNVGMVRLKEKVEFANRYNLKFSEFGTRRRNSKYWHDQVVKYLHGHCEGNCVGTSNVYLAKKYGMTPIGTFPHEWIMFHGACWGYQQGNYLGMRDWVRVYDGDLGIFLMDTYTSEVGLKSMSLKLAKLFDGVRQDSGDEIEIGEKVIARYEELGIDPSSKTIVFSNALDFEKYLKVRNHFAGRIKVSAGIGTNLTNDVGVTPANIVMKLSKCRLGNDDMWRNCIKVSDDLGKHQGDDKEFEIAKHQLGI